MITTYILVLSSLIFISFSGELITNYKKKELPYVPYHVLGIYIMSLAYLITYAIEALK